MLETLGEHDYGRRIERRPGQKEDRFEHMLGSRGDGRARSMAAPGSNAGRAFMESPAATAPVPGAPAQPPRRGLAGVSPPRVDVDGALAKRVATLESEVASLRAEIEELRDLLTTPAAN